jgi:hypothetical protein
VGLCIRRLNARVAALLYVGKGQLRGSRLFVSDQPIHPGVNNLYSFRRMELSSKPAM